MTCIFCQKTIPAGIKRFKQHLSGGSGDAADRPSVVASTGVGSSSSTAPDSAAYAEMAIAKLPPHLASNSVLNSYIIQYIYIYGS